MSARNANARTCCGSSSTAASHPSSATATHPQTRYAFVADRETYSEAKRRRTEAYSCWATAGRGRKNKPGASSVAQHCNTAHAR
eukprot:8743946-Pyramimonas_sp.AAC.1